MVGVQDPWEGGNEAKSPGNRWHIQPVLDHRRCSCSIDRFSGIPADNLPVEFRPLPPAHLQVQPRPPSCRRQHLSRIHNQLNPRTAIHPIQLFVSCPHLRTWIVAKSPIGISSSSRRTRIISMVIMMGLGAKIKIFTCLCSFQWEITPRG